MDEHSTTVLLKNHNLKSSSAFDSPVNNPFDEVWKKTIQVASESEQTNRRSSFRFSTDFPSISRKSLSFCDLNVSDFGRESMGILPPDFGRDSMGFMNISNLDTHRESLSTKQLIAMRESLSFRRESLKLLNLQDLGRESLDCGRESLGILHLKSPDTKFDGEDKKIPDIFFTMTEENCEINILDIAFIENHSRKLSIFSNSSSVNPSFNSLSLEGPSRISSVSSIKSYKDVKLDGIQSLINSPNLTSSGSSPISSIHSYLNKGKIFSPSELNVRSRIKSMPVVLEDQFSETNANSEFKEVSERKFFSVEKSTFYKTIERGSFCEALDFKDGDVSDEVNGFHDSVFIEGQLLAEKIADGSILHDDCDGEIGILDCTPQPIWPDDVSYQVDKDTEQKNCTNEIVFKALDKMLPPSVHLLDVKLKGSKSDSLNEHVENVNTSQEHKSAQASGDNVSKSFQNISDIQQEKRKSVSPKDPKEIFNNLSELLNSTQHSDKQKSECQSLINSLASMLCKSKSSTNNNLDDSGHSSTNEQIESPKNQCFEVLDLRKKTFDKGTTEKQVSEALDLSLKRTPAKTDVETRLSRSLYCSNSNKLETHTNKNNTSVLNFGKNNTKITSVPNNDVKSQISGKLRQKHHNSGSAKGPMKAIIPVTEMKKKDSVPATPPDKNEPKLSTLQSKRTSTPIKEPKMKPMAASTPTSSIKPTTRVSKDFKNRAGSLSKPNKSISTSKSSSNISHERSTTSGLPRSSTISQQPRPRTNSMTDIKRSIENGGMLRRRNSLEKDSGIMSAVVKSRQNLASTYAPSQRRSFTYENKSLTENKANVRTNRQLPTSKPSSMISKLKKPGKENVEGRDFKIH